MSSQRRSLLGITPRQVYLQVDRDRVSVNMEFVVKEWLLIIVCSVERQQYERIQNTMPHLEYGVVCKACLNPLQGYLEKNP